MSGAIAIRHIDLRTMEPPAGCAGPSYNIFWWGDLPLGARMAYPEQTPFGKGQLDALATEFLAEQLAAREPALGAPLRATYEGEPKHVLSFAPVMLQVPEGVNLRKVDMATELQILAYHAQRAQAPGQSA